jgi:hypothetical protein
MITEGNAINEQTNHLDEDILSYTVSDERC